MKLTKWIFAAIILLLPIGVHAVDNPTPKDPVLLNYQTKNETYRVRFATTVPANTATVIASTMTFDNLIAASGIAYSPSLVSSSSNTFGGRVYTIFQVVTASGSAKVFIDKTTADMDVSGDLTSPYLYQGSWYTPDNPISDQGSLVIQSTVPVSVSGWMWFDRPKH